MGIPQLSRAPWAESLGSCRKCCGWERQKCSLWPGVNLEASLEEVYQTVCNFLPKHLGAGARGAVYLGDSRG